MAPKGVFFYFDAICQSWNFLSFHLVLIPESYSVYLFWQQTLPLSLYFRNVANKATLVHVCAANKHITTLLLPLTSQ